MSFNNYVDADAAWQLVCDFEDIACAIIKHTNPAGVALASNAEEAYRKALACDPVSAFGGIVAFNAAVDDAATRAVTEIFIEVIIAPDFDEAALEILRRRKICGYCARANLNRLKDWNISKSLAACWCKRATRID